MNARGLSGLLIVSLLLARVAGASSCLAWPGEPTPLPSRDDPDALRGLWAELRVQELVAAARASESAAPLSAQRLWRHVQCLDPSNRTAAAGLERTRVVAVARPPIVALRKPALEPAEAVAWTDLGAPLRVRVALPTASRKAPRREPPAWDARAADAAIGEAREQLQAARFEEALAAAEQAREKLAGAGAAERRRRDVELDVLTATAQLALGRGDPAQRSLGRALAADPELRLEPSRTPPKVLRALEQARATRRAGEH